MPNQLTLEQTVLVDCAAASADAGRAWRIGEAALRRVDWTLVDDLAQRHRVPSLLERRLRSASAGAPAVFFRRLEHERVGRTAANLAAVEQLKRLLAAMAAADVPIVPYKGPCLAVMGYGELGARIFGDLDFLVPRSARPRAARVCLDAGYDQLPRPRGPLIAFVREAPREEVFIPRSGGLPVELQVAAGEWPLGIRIEPDAVVARARPLVVAGREVLTPCREDALLLSAIHGLSHAWYELKLVADIHALATGPLDWDAAVRTAEEAHGRRTLAVALLLANELCRTPVPADVLAGFRRDEPAVTLARQAVGHMFDARSTTTFAGRKRLQWWRWRLHVRSRDRAVESLGYALKNLVYQWTLD